MSAKTDTAYDANDVVWTIHSILSSLVIDPYDKYNLQNARRNIDLLEKIADSMEADAKKRGFDYQKEMSKSLFTR